MTRGEARFSSPPAEALPPDASDKKRKHPKGVPSLYWEAVFPPREVPSR